MPNPNLTISPVLPEEAALYQAIRHETFRPTVNKILYTREPTPKTLNTIIATTSHEIRNKAILYMKCVDSTTGQVVAGARWRYMGSITSNPAHHDGDQGGGGGGGAMPGPRTWQQVDEDLEIPPPYEESDPAVFNAFFALFAANKREIMGTRPYFALDTLVTHPDHHRRGAGGMLVQWGCEKADELGVEAFLEASPMGQPLYARFGFEVVREVEIDLRKYGGDEVLRFILMRRPAKGQRCGEQ